MWTDVRTDVPTDGRAFPPLMLLGQLGGVDLINSSNKYIKVQDVLLTGQRAANFRLLANQSAEHRLVMQRRHGCRAMR